MGISLRQLDLALKQAGKIGFSDWVSPVAIVIVKTGEEMDEINASPEDQGSPSDRRGELKPSSCFAIANRPLLPEDINLERTKTR